MACSPPALHVVVRKGTHVCMGPTSELCLFSTAPRLATSTVPAPPCWSPSRCLLGSEAKGARPRAQGKGCGCRSLLSSFLGLCPSSHRNVAALAPFLSLSHVSRRWYSGLHSLCLPTYPRFWCHQRGEDCLPSSLSPQAAQWPVGVLT